MEKRITQTAFLHNLPDFVEKLHKSGKAALGLSCEASFELPNSVYFGSGAPPNSVFG